jgi:hypothetical protein
MQWPADFVKRIESGFQVVKNGIGKCVWCSVNIRVSQVEDVKLHHHVEPNSRAADRTGGRREFSTITLKQNTCPLQQ